MRSAHRTARRTVIGVLGCAGALTAFSAPAHAATATWTCSADAVTATVAGMSALNPITAARTPCADQSVGLPNTTDAIGLAPTINARTAYAVTAARPATARPIGQTVAGAAGVEGLEVTTGEGTVVIGVGAAQSSATGVCQDGVPRLAGTSQVTGLTINGQTVTLDGPLTGLTDAISGSPLGGLVSVKLNEQVVDGSGLVQRAAHVTVLSAAGTPLADVVVAQSAVSAASACDPAADGNVDPSAGGGGSGSGGTGTGTGTGGQSGASAALLAGVCPAGSTLDTARVVCVISATNSGGQGEIVIGRPFTGPSGGTVLSLTNARKRFKSVCLQGSGPQYAIVGTNGRDNITGRNTGDRILALGGTDQVDGGRGNDCIDGGSGRDNLAGGIGNDRVFGTTGNDALNGGPGTDRLSGASGNDSINAAFGPDRILAGAGSDAINVATAGKAASVTCGGGRDKVRINRNERRRLTACEVVYMLAD